MADLCPIARAAGYANAECYLCHHLRASHNQYNVHNMEAWKLFLKQKLVTTPATKHWRMSLSRIKWTATKPRHNIQLNKSKNRLSEHITIMPGTSQRTTSRTSLIHSWSSITNLSISMETIRIIRGNEVVCSYASPCAEHRCGPHAEHLWFIRDARSNGSISTKIVLYGPPCADVRKCARYVHNRMSRPADWNVNRSVLRCKKKTQNGNKQMDELRTK